MVFTKDESAAGMTAGALRRLRAATAIERTVLSSRDLKIWAATSGPSPSSTAAARWAPGPPG